eukprot:TRINITY_DN12371_c0_g1_i1.p1 TRINITY_DN12371_c0_g1~~TRINITY_DN12371_c0_g1_i1.p1  ORF type:complete len:761 (-),score=195.44 TRINITY_DN12371_c0_g1_i1:79-2361(-)
MSKEEAKKLLRDIGEEEGRLPPVVQERVDTLINKFKKREEAIGEPYEGLKPHLRPNRDIDPRYAHILVDPKLGVEEDFWRRAETDPDSLTAREKERVALREERLSTKNYFQNQKALRSGPIAAMGQPSRNTGDVWFDGARAANKERRLGNYRDLYDYVHDPPKGTFHAVTQYIFGPKLNQIMMPNFETEDLLRPYTFEHFKQFSEDCPEHALRIAKFSQEDFYHREMTKEAAALTAFTTWYTGRPFRWTPRFSVFPMALAGATVWYTLCDVVAKHRAGTIGYDREQSRRAMLWNYYRHLQHEKETVPEDESMLEFLRPSTISVADLVSRANALERYAGDVNPAYGGPKLLDHRSFSQRVLQDIDWKRVATRAGLAVANDDDDEEYEFDWDTADLVRQDIDLPLKGSQANVLTLLQHRRAQYEAKAQMLYSKLRFLPFEKSVVLYDYRYWKWVPNETKEGEGSSDDGFSGHWTNEVADLNLADAAAFALDWDGQIPTIEYWATPESPEEQAIRAKWNEESAALIKKLRKRELAYWPELRFYLKDPESYDFEERFPYKPKAFNTKLNYDPRGPPVNMKGKHPSTWDEAERIAMEATGNPTKEQLLQDQIAFRKQILDNAEEYAQHMKEVEAQAKDSLYERIDNRFNKAKKVYRERMNKAWEKLTDPARADFDNKENHPARKDVPALLLHGLLPAEYIHPDDVAAIKDPKERDLARAIAHVAYLTKYDAETLQEMKNRYLKAKGSKADKATLDALDIALKRKA